MISIYLLPNFLDNLRKVSHVVAFYYLCRIYSQMDKQTYISKAVSLRCQSQSVASSYLTSVDDIEDAVQDVMLKLWEQHENLLDDDAKLKGYVSTLTHNICIDRQKVRRRHPIVSLFHRNKDGTEVSVMREITAADNPHTCLEMKEAHDITMAAIERLPDNWKAVVIMRNVQDMSFAEIAQILGTSESSVRGTLSKARRKLIEFTKDIR